MRFCPRRRTFCDWPCAKDGCLKRDVDQALADLRAKHPDIFVSDAALAQMERDIAATLNSKRS